eukprot:511381_1
MVSTNLMQHQKHFTISNFVDFFCSHQWTFYFLKYIMDKVVKNNGYHWTMIIIHVMVMKLILQKLVLKKELCKRSRSYWLWICGYGSNISTWYKAKLRDKKYYGVDIKEGTREGIETAKGERTYKDEARKQKVDEKKIYGGKYGKENKL